MLGLHNAAASMAYSLVNVAPSNNIRAGDSSMSVFRRSASSSAWSRNVPTRSRCRPSNRVMTSSSDERTSSSSRARMRFSTAPARESWCSNPSVPGTKSRVMTLDGSAASRCGLRVTSPARTEVIAGQRRSVAHAATSRSQPASTPRPGSGSPRRREVRRTRHPSPGPT